MVIDGSDVATIVPNTDILDDEARALIAFVQAIEAAQHYQGLVYEARSARGCATEDLEADQDTLCELARGYTRALGRRQRDVGRVLDARARDARRPWAVRS
jgi:hypothetical protein